jgi:hypothetical protein
LSFLASFFTCFHFISFFPHVLPSIHPPTHPPVHLTTCLPLSNLRLSIYETKSSPLLHGTNNSLLYHAVTVSSIFMVHIFHMVHLVIAIKPQAKRRFPSITRLF